MKTKFFAFGLLGTVVAALVLIGSRPGEISSAQAQPYLPSSAAVQAPSLAPPAPPSGARPADVQSAPAALPSNILPSGPLAQVIRLVQAGVDESIVLTYVSNSASTFNLDADKIIYLNDVGVPNVLVSAMMQRDQILQTQFAAASPPPSPAPQAPETTETYSTDVAPPPEPEVVTVNYFNDTLSPYGNWVNVDGYGRCWRPTVVVYNSGWSPYCDRGHWVYTDSGWYWNSDYSWGATFHYGRWFRDARFGWCWWPDTVWAPSWVTWRYADNYCGWAPVPPFAVWQSGIGFVYRGNGVSVGFDFGLSANSFIFVSANRFCDPHPRRYRCEPAEVTRIYNHTTVINNFNFDSHNRTVINTGINVQHIAAATHTTIRPVEAQQLRRERTEQIRQNALNTQAEHRPGAAAGNGNPLRTGSGFENRNTGATRTESPAQNGSGRPGNDSNRQVNRNGTTTGQPATVTPTQNRPFQRANDQGQSPTRNWSAPDQNPAQSPAQNRAGQSPNYQNPQGNRSGSDNLPARNFGDDKRVVAPRVQQSETQTPRPTPPPSAANNGAFSERMQTRSEARIEARQNNSDAPRVSQPSAPAPAPAAQPAQASGQSERAAARADRQDQNQNGRGH